ncbi:hypothetical protein ElyMa_004254200 [Elysia marginata]|uniref:Uncharacterized protein n=1 Tax=Elysia marginata TaxID=1093978 RepID=A0AAV4GSJ2_9GAST|nr:hypothetical protein ElyMa_004254200 [Elysia marginata]
MAENKRFRKEDSTDSVEEEKKEDKMMMVIMSKIEKKMEEKMGRIEATLAGFLREMKEMMSEVGDRKDCEEGGESGETRGNSVKCSQGLGPNDNLRAATHTHYPETSGDTMT